MDSRNQLFQILKPRCVRVSHAALNLAARKGDNGELLQALEQLLQALNRNHGLLNALDAKIADYIFFPLSHVLKQTEKIPVRSLELAVLIIRILLRTGWRSNLAPNLGIQLLILLTLISSNSSERSKPTQSSEELRVASFDCLSSLFASLSDSIPDGRAAFTETANIPALGHAVTVMLEGVADGASVAVQLAALGALNEFSSVCPDDAALATFLPGIVSCLTKVLTPSASSRRSYKTMTAALQILSIVLPRVMADERLNQGASLLSRKDEQHYPSPSWFKAASTQIKMALANVVRLQTHEKSGVRDALLSLCTSVIQSCRKSLSESIPMVIETLVTLSVAEEGSNAIEIFKRLISTDSEAAEMLKSSLHAWITSLPRIIESTDDDAYTQTVSRVSLTLRLLGQNNAESSIINRDLSLSLRDSISSLLHSEKNGNINIRAIESSSSVIPLPGDRKTDYFKPSLATSPSSSRKIKELQSLIKHMSISQSYPQMARNFLDTIGSSHEPTRLSSFWLALNLVRFRIKHNDISDTYLDVASPSSRVNMLLLEELYSSSLAALADQDTVGSWKVQAIALEVVALQAENQGEDFRNELVEALYPVITLIGASEPALRNHAMVCLNKISKSCGYDSASDLIVANVDYLVNAVALKLHAFDMTPQAPQVLLMMIKFSGPALLPYLDDVVDDIFGALESFHGYPRLVELLFSVLRAVAEEAVKLPRRALTSGKTTWHAKSRLEPINVEDVARALKDINHQRARNQTLSEDEQPSESGHPQRPWKDLTQASIPESEGLSEAQDTGGAVSQTNSGQPPVVPKIYSLLLKIAQLTQHYLTSASANLRGSLLSLLDQSIPTLASDEDSFLPLINTLWPIIVTRLHDPEAYVIASALDVVGQFSIHAGDFLKGRIESAWEDLRKVYHQTAREVLHDNPVIKAKSLTWKITSSNSGEKNSALAKSNAIQSPIERRYISTSSKLVWESLIWLLSRIAKHVTVEENVFDEILDMLMPVFVDHPEIKESLETRNPDAVWLALLRLDNQDLQVRLGCDVDFWKSARPSDMKGLQFAEVV